MNSVCIGLCGDGRQGIDCLDPTWNEPGLRQDEDRSEEERLLPQRDLYFKKVPKYQPPGCCSRCCCCLGCLLLLLLPLLLVAQLVVAMKVAPSLLERRSASRQGLYGCAAASAAVGARRRLAVEDDADANASEVALEHRCLLTPVNATTAMDFPVCRGGIDGPMANEMVRLNEDHPWQLVTFPSRAGVGETPLNLTGWWLPAEQPTAPRVVVVHGEEANYNHWTVQTVAYLLRSVGFGVLVPNLRDHGSSPGSDREAFGWGLDYHLDVLGAWDFAVHDKGGVLGGSQSEHQVGLLGIGFGGYAVLNAFGLEPSIPGVWVDSAPADLRVAMSNLLEQKISTWLDGVAEQLPGFLEDIAADVFDWVAPYLPWLFKDTSWRYLEFKTGLDLDKFSPSSTLPKHALGESQARPVAIIHSKLDDEVPWSQSEELVGLLDFNKQYKVKLQYEPESVCGQTTHAATQLWDPGNYRKKLCSYWSEVFGTMRSTCNLTELANLNRISLLQFATSTTTTTPPSTTTTTWTNTTTTTSSSTSSTSTTNTTTSTTTTLVHGQAAPHSALWNIMHGITTTTTTTTLTTTSTTPTSTTTTTTTTTSTITTSSTTTSSTTTNSTTTSTLTNTTTTVTGSTTTSTSTTTTSITMSTTTTSNTTTSMTTTSITNTNTTTSSQTTTTLTTTTLTTSSTTPTSTTITTTTGTTTTPAITDTSTTMTRSTTTRTSTEATTTTTRISTREATVL
mmetsp:Transcript_70104/g.203283  ORF Transcript_70104/g.203283 Transcript_70104/m.203283 type:complete len:733 (-) Transcript_70104:274-2472(-)